MVTLYLFVFLVMVVVPVTFVLFSQKCVTGSLSAREVRLRWTQQHGVLSRDLSHQHEHNGTQQLEALMGLLAQQVATGERCGHFDEGLFKFVICSIGDCCSAYGYCGSTPQHCSDGRVPDTASELLRVIERSPEVISRQRVNTFTSKVNRARTDLLQRCPSLLPSAMSKVGVTPGSIDIVITTVNFTTSSDPTSPVHVKLDVGKENNYCEPRATIDEHEHGPGTKQWGKFHPQRCDHTTGSASCCVRAEKGVFESFGKWGACEVPSKSNKHCRCRDCFDYRLRRRALQFDEVRQQLRSFEANGLFVQSKTHPNGVVRKIFIVYNEGPANNPPPTWLRSEYPHVVTISHKTLFQAHDPEDLTGYPTGNRNAIVALLHRIPKLGDWILYLEDDFYLNRRLSFHGDNTSYFTNDGRVVSHLGNGNVHAGIAQKQHGYEGAMWSANRALAKHFGPRLPCSHSLVKGLEDEVVGIRRGESVHTPYLWPRCVLEELYRLWPGEYNSTIRSKNTKNNVQHHEDFSVTTHAGMFLEDLGLGKNVARAHIASNFHTNGGRGSKLANFVQSVCNHAHQKDVDWLQVQGNGISDEYIAETNEARGDIRFAWQALSEAMWPLQSAAEINRSSGENSLYHGIMLRNYGEDMCAKG